MPDEKQCAECKAVKPVDQFHKDKHRTDGLRSYCKTCSTARYRKWRDANPERARESWRRASNRYGDRGNYLWKRYGLSQEAYSQLAEQQDGRCLICQEEAELVVDHCHDSGFVRGLLCGNCNTGLGMFMDDPRRVEAALNYLRTAQPMEYRAGGGTRERSARVDAHVRRRCEDCGDPCSINAARCRSCHSVNQYRSRRTTIEWPALEELLALVDATSYVEVGRKLGVSDNAVRKHIKAEVRVRAALPAAR